ncbi:MAG: RHS repeat-associated core domain-containing protein, partial [Kiritimatiellae bacterium]|nr:RHS repeat-associated core domain-containing protein [Kiritimatiellia bacterium]
GTDLTGSLQGDGGVGGLLAVKLNETWYAPLYDANGNITAYVSENGDTVATYEYDAFGATISQSGMMADTFRHRFSTKPWIVALDVYDFGERVYSPELRRWLSRDPIGEEGGVNLYAMCGNDAVNGVDILGNVRYMGKSRESGYFYKFIVNKCEVAIIYGHGHGAIPHEVSFEDKKTSSVYFWGVGLIQPIRQSPKKTDWLRMWGHIVPCSMMKRLKN